MTRNDSKSLLKEAEALFNQAVREEMAGWTFVAQQTRESARRKLALAVVKLDAGEQYEAPKAPAEVIREELEAIRKDIGSGTANVERAERAILALTQLEAAK